MYGAYGKVEIPETGEILGTGWLPPLPDLRDFTEEEDEIAAMTRNLGIAPTKTSLSLPPDVDLSGEEFMNTLAVLMENEKISMQYIPWSDLDKDYRYLNLALDIALSKRSPE